MNRERPREPPHQDSAPTVSTSDPHNDAVAGNGIQPWRRLFHAASGVALAFGPGLLGLGSSVIPILAGLLTASVLLDAIRLRVPRVNALFFRVGGRLASPREAKRFASSTWYLLGVLLVYAFLPAHAVPAVLVLGLADPAASVVGRRWGRRRLGKGTVVGSTTFLVVAGAVLLATAGGGVALATAVVVAAVEPLPLRLDDNLTVPVVVALALEILGG